jgi:transcriptional regulator with XRE-family HTH domain
MLDESFLILRLASLRTKKGVSARDMSLSIGQSPNYINNIESRKSYPSMTFFYYICEYLGVTPGEFFDGDSVNPARLKELMDEMKRLDDAREHMLALARGLNAKKRGGT